MLVEKKKVKKQKSPENIIQASILEYLTAIQPMTGIVFWRQNNTPIWDAKIKMFRKFPKYSALGLADIFLSIPRESGMPLTVFLEVKSKVGVISENQKGFRTMVESIGNIYLVANDVSIVEDFLREKGVVK